MTPLHQAAQQALDALEWLLANIRRNAPDLSGKAMGNADAAITALREALNAPEQEPVALESVHLTRDTKGMCVVRVNGRVAIRDNGDIIDHMATLEWFAAPPAAPDHLRDVAEKVAPAAPAQPAVRHVRKVGGSFQHTGTVVAEFRTAAGEPRIVLEFDAPVTGMLHVYRPDQVEPCEPVAPAAPAAPVVREPQPEPVQRLMRFAGKKRSEVSNPCLTAREAIVIADWMQAHGIGTTGGAHV